VLLASISPARYRLLRRRLDDDGLDEPSSIARGGTRAG
jgi:hypothetical protein